MNGDTERRAYHDLPWDELIASAQATMAHGATVYQKFTCENCGARQTIDVPDKFFTEGMCEECSHITDLQKRGGGYMAHFKVAP